MRFRYVKLNLGISIVLALLLKTAAFPVSGDDKSGSVSESSPPGQLRRVQLPSSTKAGGRKPRGKQGMKPSVSLKGTKGTKAGSPYGETHTAENNPLDSTFPDLPPFPATSPVPAKPLSTTRTTRTTKTAVAGMEDKDAVVTTTTSDAPLGLANNLNPQGALDILGSSMRDDHEKKIKAREVDMPVRTAMRGGLRKTNRNMKRRNGQIGLDATAAPGV